MPDTSEFIKSYLKQKTYFETTDFPSCYLDIEWDHFEDYKRFIQKVISKKMKKTVQNEINRNKKAGIRITPLHDIQDANNELFKLIDNHHRRLNQTSYPFNSQYLIRLKETFEEKGIIYTASKNGTYIAVCVTLRHKDTVYVPVIGVNHDAVGNDFTYFNLAFYKPIKDAVGAGVKRIIFGNAQYRAKMRRGCKLHYITVYYKPCHIIFNPIANYWFNMHRKHFMKKIANQVNGHIWW